MSVEALSSTRPGSLLLLIASKSKKTFSTLIISCLYQFNNYTKTTRVFHLSGVKLRTLGAGGLSWGSTSWSVQRLQRGLSRWRGSTGTRTSAIPLTASWTTTLPWLSLPQISSLQTSSATPACRTSRPASNQDTTAGWPAGETPGVSSAERYWDAVQWQNFELKS